MFTTLVDVAIGLIFVYLLLSLMCSAANEIIELLLKKRAIDLERGIREMLAPGSGSGTKDIVQKLYNHALINNLFGERYENSRIANKFLRKFWRTHLPSYIPARSFALALMDLVATEPGALASPPLTSPPTVAPPLSGATGSTPASNFEVKLTQPPRAPLPPGHPDNPLTLLREAIATSDLLKPIPPPAKLIKREEDAKKDKQEEPPMPLDVRKGLIALVDAAGDDVAKARENIETWFNNSMDRVSSWYKRRTQVVILILGLFVAVATNADSVAIANKLSTDKALRESLVAASMEYAKAHASPEQTQAGAGNTSGGAGQANANASAPPAASPSPTNTPTPCPSPTPTPELPKLPEACKDPTSPECIQALPAAIPECKTDPDSDACKTKAELLSECVRDPKSSACKHARVLLAIPECISDRDSHACKDKALLASIPACNECKPGKGDPKDSPQCKYEFNQRQLNALNLPIGWGSVDDVQRKWPGRNLNGPGGWVNQIQWHLLGWLLTALAISLGAPFWFDLLNKFIVIRSAVKPHEKSPEEESKD